MSFIPASSLSTCENTDTYQKKFETSWVYSCVNCSVLCPKGFTPYGGKDGHAFCCEGPLIPDGEQYAGQCKGSQPPPIGTSAHTTCCLNGYDGKQSSDIAKYSPSNCERLPLCRNNCPAGYYPYGGAGGGGTGFCCSEPPIKRGSSCIDKDLQPDAKVCCNTGFSGDCQGVPKCPPDFAPPT